MKATRSFLFTSFIILTTTSSASQLEVPLVSDVVTPRTPSPDPNCAPPGPTSAPTTYHVLCAGDQCAWRAVCTTGECALGICRRVPEAIAATVAGAATSQVVRGVAVNSYTNASTLIQVYLDTLELQAQLAAASHTHSLTDIGRLAYSFFTTPWEAQAAVANFPHISEATYNTACITKDVAGAGINLSWVILVDTVFSAAELLLLPPEYRYYTGMKMCAWNKTVAKCVPSWEWLTPEEKLRMLKQHRDAPTDPKTESPRSVTQRLEMSELAGPDRNNIMVSALPAAVV